jgi:hypothetical protein
MDSASPRPFADNAPDPESWLASMHTLSFRIASADAPLLLVPAKVNGQGPFDFVLDTGNGAPVDFFVSPSLLGRIGVGAGAGDQTSPSSLLIDSIEFGDCRLERVRAGVLEAMDQIGERISVPIAGNLGYHFLKSWRVTIDYGESTISLDRFAEPGSAPGVPFTTGPGGAFILLPAMLNGQGPYRFLVDSGASSTVISPALAQRLEIPGQPVEAMGVEGGLAAQTLTLGSLEAGGQRLEELPAAAVDVFEYTSRAAGVPVEGVLGFSFLCQFRVTIDYPRQLIAFERPERR